MPEFAPTDRTRIGRLPDRATRDVETARTILDEALYCHLGIVRSGHPVVLPTIHARIDDTLYLHGSPASALLRDAAAAEPVCCTVTLLDGLVLARSAFHHSMNYRSVVIFGKATEVTDPKEKEAALAAIVEHVAPGRGADCRPPSPKEAAGTTVLSLPIVEASVKIRTGPPGDAEKDLDLPHWAGVLPLRLQAGEPIPDEGTVADVPAYLRSWAR